MRDGWATRNQSSPFHIKPLSLTCVSSLRSPPFHSHFLPGWEKSGLLSWLMTSARTPSVHEVKDVPTILNLKKEEVKLSIFFIPKGFLAHCGNLLLLPHPTYSNQQEHREGLSLSGWMKSYFTTIIQLHFDVFSSCLHCIFLITWIISIWFYCIFTCVFFLFISMCGFSYCYVNRRSCYRIFTFPRRANKWSFSKKDLVQVDQISPPSETYF